MGSVNKVILVGNLGADPELKYTPTSRPLCNLRIATTEVYKDKSGQRQEKTEWHRVTVWGDQAENCNKYLAKGRSVYIEGRLQTRSYDKDGQKHYATDVVADRVVFLGSGGGGGGEGGRGGGRRWRWRWRGWRTPRRRIFEGFRSSRRCGHRRAARVRRRYPVLSRPPGKPRSSPVPQGILGGSGRAMALLQPAYRSAEIDDRIHAGGSSARCGIGPPGADPCSGLGREPE